MDHETLLRLVNPAWRHVLVVGATTNDRIASAARQLVDLVPGVRVDLLLPAGRESPAPGVFAHVLPAAGESISAVDFQVLAAYDAVVLAIGHVGRSAYPVLVRACCAVAGQAFLYGALGLQPLDERDGRETWPEPIRPASAAGPARPRSWLFFRPSDQSAFRLADQWQRAGATVHQAETLKAFDLLLPQVEGVFLDWCLADYGILFPALQAALDAGKRVEGFVALDLADVTEDPARVQRIKDLNQSALTTWHHAHVLATRGHIARRYGLELARCSPLLNLPDETVWFPAPRPSAPRNAASLRIAYHGLFYFWHEVAEFQPVYEELLRHGPASLDLYGRVHESVCLGGQPLFPESERAVRLALDQLAALPGVTRHGFTPPAMAAAAIREADFYLGITAGATLMSRTEMRTGVEEALRLGTPVLHKTTPAMGTRGLVADRDYVAVDAQAPQAAADRILQRRRATL